ncbi:chromosome partition protein Smc [Calothrix sp. NIES-4101]|nr:chromosome partition protein Smc [Calothrix sp. NIES-4101]
MKTLTDLEVAKQLDELWQTIERGMKVSHKVLEKAQKIQTFISHENKKVEQITSDSSLIANTIQNSIRQIQEQQLNLSENIKKASQISDNIAFKVEKISNYDGILDNFKQELENIQNSFELAQNQVQELQSILPEFNHDFFQNLDEIKAIAFQINTNQQEIVKIQKQTEDAANETSKSYLRIQEIKNEIESIFSEFGGKEYLKKLNCQHQEAITEIECLHRKIDNQIQKQNAIRNWLIAVSFGFGLTFIVAIAR